MITSRQNEVLSLISEHIRLNGVAPTIDELRDRMGLKSKASIHRMIASLEERGFIRRLHHRARAIEVIKMPSSLPIAAGGIVYTIRRDAAGQAVAIERNGCPFLDIVTEQSPNDLEIAAVVEALNTGIGSPGEVLLQESA